MDTRETLLTSLRGTSIGTVSEQSTSEEAFQNTTLRPILKIQNDLLLQVFINYAQKQKSLFFELSPDKKMNYIEHAVQRDEKFRNSLKGMVIGLFSIEEYKSYIINSSNLNKRMMNMLIERLKSQIQIMVPE